MVLFISRGYVSIGFEFFEDGRNLKMVLPSFPIISSSRHPILLIRSLLKQKVVVNVYSLDSIEEGGKWDRRHRRSVSM